jgi:uncharacterized protein YecE (DUF72 family)
VKLLAGTSGYAFKEWKGSFYPDDLRDDDMLGYYSSRFPTVEINNTFYRLPKQNVLLEWASRVPDSFTFSIKASQRITHFARLKAESAGPLEFLLRNTEVMGDKLGPILFQLPPNLKKDMERLRNFLALLPPEREFTIEFRNETWFDEEVYEELRKRDVAMCMIDQSGFSSPLMCTATWGYVRLHRQDYDSAALMGWAERLKTQPWTHVYTYMKHDHGEGSGPGAVQVFTRMWEGTDAGRGQA